jgi:hypothetical protein
LDNYFWFLETNWDHFQCQFIHQEENAATTAINNIIGNNNNIDQYAE